MGCRTTAWTAAHNVPLRNCIEGASVLGSTRFIEPDDLPEEFLEPAKPAAGFSQANGHHKQAADLLDIHPNPVLRMIRRLGIRPHLR